MNPEIPEFEKIDNACVKQERQKISPEQKKILGEVWTEMVVDNSDTPKNISVMTTEEIKKWLFESAMKDVESFTNELGLKNDQVLIEKIQKTENLGEKSALELKYIRNVHAQVDSLVHNFDRSENKSTKWDSWPKRMRETKEFNCVGATLLGINFLEKSGIKSYYGNPGGHVVNIAKLSNGEWWYVDFRNGKQNIIRIEPEETFLADVLVLKINHLSIDYKLIPIYENSEAACSILSNLASLKSAAENKNIPDENIENKEAKEYLEKYKSKSGRFCPLKKWTDRKNCLNSLLNSGNQRQGKSFPELPRLFRQLTDWKKLSVSNFCLSPTLSRGLLWDWRAKL